jgi:sugar phosphate isomerase/epimerase
VETGGSTTLRPRSRVSATERLQAVPGDRILGVQLSDASAEPEADLVAATLHERRLPGHGELDLATLVRILVEMAANAPIGVEVFSDALGALSPVEIGRRAGAATRELLTESGVER